MQITTGEISATHEHRVVADEFELSDMLLTDAAMNPGDSGGPWVDRGGQVVALSESGPPYDPSSQDRAQGNNGGVSARDAGTHIDRWQDEPRPLDPCAPPPTPVQEALTTLAFYFQFINDTDYESAYAQLDSTNHPLSGLNAFVEDVTSTQDHRVGGNTASWPLYDVLHVDVQGDHIVADVRFESHQHSEQGPEGLSCAEWHLRYEFVFGNGVQAIHSSSAVEGEPKYQPCESGDVG
jgi:hypothetical protein